MSEPIRPVMVGPDTRTRLDTARDELGCAPSATYDEIIDACLDAAGVEA